MVSWIALHLWFQHFLIDCPDRKVFFSARFLCNYPGATGTKQQQQHSVLGQLSFDRKKTTWTLTCCLVCMYNFSTVLFPPPFLQHNENTMETSSPTYNLLQWFVQWFLMGLYPLSWFLGVIIEIWGLRVGCGHDRCYQDTLFLVCWSDTLQRYIADILQYKNVMLWKPPVTSQQSSVYWNAKQNKRQKKKKKYTISHTWFAIAMCRV